MRRVLTALLCLSLIAACEKTPATKGHAGPRKRTRAPDVVKTVQPAPKPDTRKWVAQAIDTKLDDEARAAALDEITKAGDTAAIYPLAGALSNDNGDFKQDILEALSKLKATEVLCNDLDGGDDRLKIQASSLMFMLRDPKTFESLEDALLDDNLQVRVQSATALRVLKDARAVPALIGVLELNAELEARTAAAQALIEIGGDAADAALEKALQTEKDPMLKAIIERALPEE